MESLYNYITSPETLISIVVFVFGLGTIYTKITWKIRECEKRLDKIEELDLEGKLTQMQIDLDWIKKTLDELKMSRK